MSIKEQVERIGSVIKQLFWLFLFLQFVPTIIRMTRSTVTEITNPKALVGCIDIRDVIDNAHGQIKHLRSFAENKQIKAILLRINSPGGVPGSAQLWYSEIIAAKKKKPVVVLVENICASAAYYIASVSSWIVSSPSALVGSIGGYMELPNVNRLMDDWKIHMNYVKSGKYKLAGSPYKELDPEDLPYLQEVSDDIYSQFIHDVATGRSLSIETASEWAEGRIMSGAQAHKQGLVDELGSVTETYESIMRLANFKEEIRLIHPPRISRWQKIIGSDEEESTAEELASSVSRFASSLFEKIRGQIGLKAAL